MATLYGVNATKAMVNVPADKVQSGDYGGRIHCLLDSYTLTADLAANDVIVIGQLPAGARIVGYWFKSADLDSGSTGTMDLGWAASADGVESASANGFLSAVNVQAAVTSGHTSQNNMAGLGKSFASAVNVQIKVSGDTNATSGTVMACIQYTY